MSLKCMSFHSLQYPKALKVPFTWQILLHMVLKDPVIQPHVLLHLSHTFKHLRSMFKRPNSFHHAMAPIWLAFRVTVRHSEHDCKLWSWLLLNWIPSLPPPRCVTLDCCITSLNLHLKHALLRASNEITDSFHLAEWKLPSFALGNSALS